MAKSTILKQLANNEISIEVALQRLLIIASDVEDENLASWAKNELNGYKESDLLPEYRISINPYITYSGINGRYQVKNASMPIQIFPEKYRKSIETFHNLSSISIIENCEKDGQNKCRDLTFLAGYVYEKKGIQCVGIQQIISSESYKKIVSNVKTILLQIFIKLEKTFGNLDDLDVDINSIDTKTKDDVKNVIYNYIYQDKSVRIGDSNDITKSDIANITE